VTARPGESLLPEEFAARCRAGRAGSLGSEQVFVGEHSEIQTAIELTVRVVRGIRLKLLDYSAMVPILDELRLESVPQLGTVVLDHSVDELVDFSAWDRLLKLYGDSLCWMRWS
jgi:hypothetical protein